MSKYKGTLQHLNVLNGKISGRLLKLKAQLMEVGSQFEGSIKQQDYYNGKLHSTFSLAGIVKKVYYSFRFFKVKKHVRVKHDANLFAATTAELNGIKKAKDKLSAPIIAAETTNAKVDSRTRASITARLRAYYKGSLEFVAKLFTLHKANLTTVESTTAKYQEEIKTKSSTDINITDSTVCKSENNIECQVKAVGIVADANATTAKRIVKSKVEAVGSVAVAHNASIANEIKAQSKATAGIVKPVEVNIHNMPKVSHTANISYYSCVTFCDYKGDVLFQKMVKRGESCFDPVEQGEIEAPTKPSDAQYHYRTFTGWSFINGGDADEIVLTNITKPITVYPAFEKELRYYNIRFFDGETLLTTLSVAYGDTPSYTPVKAGYVFVSWTPEIVPVTGDAAYGAMWIMDCIASGTCGDNLTWVLTKQGELIISGEGAMANYSDASAQPWVGYVSEIKTITIEEGVTAIGNQSLRALTNVTSVTIPDSVTRIGLSAFLGCTSITQIDIPSSVTVIDAYAFNECSGLKSIIIPDGVKRLYYCFYKCTSLESVVINGTSMTEIGYCAFYQCAALRTITCPSSVTVIGAYAFYGCTALAYFTNSSGSYVYPNWLVNIDNYAFYNCQSLKFLPVGGTTLTRIGSYAFYGTKGCNTSIQMSSAIAVIGPYAFDGSAIKTISGGNWYKNWYYCTSETATTGKKMSLSALTNTGVCQEIKVSRRQYWIKII